MALSRWILAIGLVAFSLGCAGTRVTEDYDVNADFSSYATFSWLPKPQGMTGDARIDNPLIAERVRSAIERTLMSKGYRPATETEPDFYVGYFLSLEQKLDVYTIDRYYSAGPYRRWDAPGFETHVSQYEEGTLVIDIVDAKAGRLVWRGSGSRRISKSPTPQKTTQRVNEAVEAILKRFPPH
jgi:hypothetical protein